MSNQQEPESDNIKELTNAIMGAIGIKTGEGQKVQSASVSFLKT